MLNAAGYRTSTGTQLVYQPKPGTSDPWGEKPLWPAGRTIYFKSQEPEGAAFWAIPAAGGRPRLLAHLDQVHPSYRPDFDTYGKQICFPVQDRQSDIWLVEIKRP